MNPFSRVLSSFHQQGDKLYHPTGESRLNEKSLKNNYMAQIIKTTGEVIEVAPKNGTDFSLEELQTIVGGYIEVVSIHYGQIIVLDEEGKLKGKDRNNKATELYRLRRLTTDFIVGDVLICDSNQIK